MNETLSKLIIEANNYAIKTHPLSEEDESDPTIKYMIVGNRIFESQRKLAESIIKECGQVMESYDPDFDWATVELKKHFGVEE